MFEISTGGRPMGDPLQVVGSPLESFGRLKSLRDTRVKGGHIYDLIARF